MVGKGLVMFVKQEGGKKEERTPCVLETKQWKVVGEKWRVGGLIRRWGMQNAEDLNGIAAV